MSKYNILAWQPLLRPPLPDQDPPAIPQVPLRALACKNSIASVASLVTASQPTANVRVEFSDLICGESKIPSSSFDTRLVGVVNAPEVGQVCDPLFEITEFAINKSAALYTNISIPKELPKGTYCGKVRMIVDGAEVASNAVEIEVANVALPNVNEWDFFLNVWLNPAAIARRYGVDLWSKEHLYACRPYIADLAAHGQKTVVAPICYQPTGDQIRDPYPSLVEWIKRGEDYEFDFEAFDKYVTLHSEFGINRAIHCYAPVQMVGDSDISIIECMDIDCNERRLVEMQVGDENFERIWGTFLKKFSEHLAERGWLQKCYLALGIKPEPLLERLAGFIEEYGNGIKLAHASSVDSKMCESADDLSLQIEVDSQGVTEVAPPIRSVMDVADLFNPEKLGSPMQVLPSLHSTTLYVCSIPEHPNTFLRSPLVESRVLPYLALQGGFDGFTRWSYNNWSDDPFEHPEWDEWPTGDTFLVYPGAHGPISSLRWEQLREGIQDYELAMIASANIKTPEEMVDYEQALTLACRDVDGSAKSTGDIEIARRLLIPIAEHQREIL